VVCSSSSAWLALAGGFNWQWQEGGGQAWSVEDIMQHFFGGAAGGFGGPGGNVFTSAAFMMDAPLRLTFMVGSHACVLVLGRAGPLPAGGQWSAGIFWRNAHA